MVIASGGLVGIGEVRVLKDSRLVGFRATPPFAEGVASSGRHASRAARKRASLERDKASASGITFNGLDFLLRLDIRQGTGVRLSPRFSAWSIARLRCVVFYNQTDLPVLSCRVRFCHPFSEVINLFLGVLPISGLHALNAGCFLCFP